MKNIKNILLTGLLAFAVCGFVACSSDDDSVAEPSLKVLNAEPYDMAELDSKEQIITTIEFNSNTSWRLVSDKMWVLFSATEDGFYFNDLRGEAGTHTVYMKITNDARTFEAASAGITFVYGDKEYYYGSIYRHAQKQVTNIKGEDGEVLKSIEMGNGTSTTISIDANYNCGIKSYPSWIGEPQLYNGSYTLNVLEENVPFAMEGDMVLASNDGTVEVAYPIIYKGMSPEKMLITGANSPWDWELSLDGKTFRNSATSLEGASEDILVENSMLYSLCCFNYDYKLLFASEGKDGSITIDDNAWLLAEQGGDNQAEVTITATPFTPGKDARSRKAYIFAVPSGIYDSFVAELNGAEDAVTFVDSHLDYVVMEVTQKDLHAAEGFDIVTEAGEKVACEQITSGEIYDWVSSELGITEVYTFTGTPGVKYEVNTLYTDDEWYGGGFSIYDDKGEVSVRSWGSPSKSKNSEGYYIIKFKVPTAGITKPTVMRLHINNVNKKALVVLPVNN